MKKTTLLATVMLSSALTGADAAPVRPAITGVSHLSVYSADMAKSDAFYTHHLGAIKGADPEDVKGVRYYFNARQFVEVLPLPTGVGINRMDHGAFNTADAEALRKYLAANKIAVPKKVTLGSDGSKYFRVKDPEGNTIEFVEASKTPLTIAAVSPSDRIIHFGMIVHSAATENTFYRALLGFKPYWFGGMTPENPTWISQQVPDGDEWMEYMVVKGPETRGIPADMSQANAGVLNHFALGVGNMEKTVTLLAGGERVSEKNDGPKIGRDGKWQFNMYDPDGTRAEFMEFHAVTKPCCSPFTAPDPKEPGE